ncbi:MAG TPA: hypothetical protein VJA45_13000 [Methylomirabilota bacterium]|nr:hypothetical protein [Methylomirabilota bacterium]
MPTPKTSPPMQFDIQWNGLMGNSTSPDAASACTEAMATRRASTYARAMAASPMKKRLASARMRQKPPRWMT